MHLPALIEDMDFATYLADPAPEPSLTSSLCKALLGTAPQKVWKKTKRLNKDAKSEEKTAFDLGSAAHRLFTGVGSPIVAIDAKAFNTNAAKAERDAAYAAGKTPILKANLPRVQAMASAALEQIRHNPDVGHLFSPENHAKLMREVTMIWTETGVMCRSRPDFYSKEENIIIHYKTTGTDVSPSTMSKFAGNQSWHITAAHYDAGARILTGKAPRQFFVVQEVEEPHLLLVTELDRTFLETAAMRRERALKIWGRCLSSNMWPGMPTRTVKLECPEWLERDMIADKDAEEEASAMGQDLIDMARAWQAPEGWQPAAVQGEYQDERDEVTE